MSGISGIYGFLPNGEGKARIEKMNEALAHRGPDAEGIMSKKFIHLGHRRLKIIDPTDASNQPLTDRSGRYTIVFNGEILNYKELRASLAGYEFTTPGDAEVLLAGLIELGIRFLKKCNGSFAFSFWDNEKKELLLGRDRLGVKPLYYARTNDHFVFASELRAVLKSGLVQGEMNGNALGDFLRYQTVHGANTIVNGVFMLPAGSYMIVSDHEMKISTYWSVVTNTQWSVNNLNYEDTKNLIRQKLDAAVALMMVSDVPIGAFLSGGIDSSAIVALASKHINNLKTFTLNFQEEEFSEAKYARLISQKYNTSHTEITLTPDALLKDLPQAIEAMDHPSGDGFNTYVVSKMAKEAGVSVVLSGLGGDELFAGYPIFKQFYSLGNKGWLMSFPKFTRRLAGNTLKIIRPGAASSKIKNIITEDYLDLENVYPYSRELNSKSIISKLTKGHAGGADAISHLLKEAVGYGTPGYDLPKLSRVTYAELLSYTEPVLLRDSDQMAMAHALQLRVPFMDHSLIETVMAVPDNYKYPTSPKKLLVDAMGEMLPPEIVNRPKMGFVFPWDTWMRNELKDFCGDQLATIAKNQWFNEKTVTKKWNQFLKNDPQVPWFKIWPLCILQAWMTQNEIK